MPESLPAPTDVFLASRTPHHLGYVVQDLEQAARSWHDMTGIGPFLLLEHIPFELIRLDDQPVSFDHSAAFAAWGPLFVELQVIHRVDPPEQRAYFEPRGVNALNHIAVAVDDPAAASAQLVRTGLPCALQARTGPLAITQHHPAEALGFSLEVHRRDGFFPEFFGAVAKAPQAWDGRDLIIPTG